MSQPLSAIRFSKFHRVIKKRPLIGYKVVLVTTPSDQFSQIPSFSENYPNRVTIIFLLFFGHFFQKVTFQARDRETPNQRDDT